MNNSTQKTPSSTASGLCKKTTIGGQALIEGIMMLGPSKIAVASRLPDGEIDVEYMQGRRPGQRHRFFKLPFIRGSFNMIDSMILGYRALMKSAEKAGLDMEEEPGPFEKKLINLFGDKLYTVLMAVAMVLGVGIAVVLFIWLPVAVFNLLNLTPANLMPFKGLIEGILKIGIFTLYIVLISRMKDIHRVFQYHGAEHKCIFTYETGLDLTVENCKNQSRFHPRCGTSFLVLVLIISILISSAVLALFPILKTVTWLWVAIKILLIPVICGVGYELIRLCGRYDNRLTRIVAAPGLWVQRITTKEPDDSMLEVAVAALTAVLPEENENDNW